MTSHVAHSQPASSAHGSPHASSPAPAMHTTRLGTARPHSSEPLEGFQLHDIRALHNTCSNTTDADSASIQSGSREVVPLRICGHALRGETPWLPLARICMVRGAWSRKARLVETESSMRLVRAVPSRRRCCADKPRETRTLLPPAYLPTRPDNFLATLLTPCSAMCMPGGAWGGDTQQYWAC